VCEGGELNKLIALTIFSLFVSGSTALAVGPGNSRAEEKAASRIENSAQIQTKIQELKSARTAERPQLEVQVVDMVKTKALAEIERIISQYDRINERVQAMKVISAEKKAEFETKITEKKDEIISYRTKIDEATTIREVRAAMQELRRETRGNSEVVKEMVAAIRATHLNGVVEKLTVILDRLEEKGGDSEMIATAKTQLEGALVLIESGEFKTAREKILEARKTMIKIAQKEGEV
jgi:hypothetical protein